MNNLNAGESRFFLSPNQSIKMKKMIIFAIIVIASLTAKSQIYIGYSLNEYKSLLNRDGITWKQSLVEGSWVLVFRNQNVKYAATFDEWNSCWFVLGVPQTQGALNAMIERYNNEAVIRSDGHWTLYQKGNGAIDIDMMRTDIGAGYSFMYSNH